MLGDCLEDLGSMAPDTAKREEARQRLIEVIDLAKSEGWEPR
jgi:hypothetical protein